MLANFRKRLAKARNGRSLDDETFDLGKDNSVKYPNVPAMFQSHFYFFGAGDSAPRLKGLYDYALGIRGLSQWSHQSGGIGIPNDLIDLDHLKEFVDYLIEQTDIDDFVVTHVIPKKHGTLSKELRSEIVRLLGDSSVWLEQEFSLRASYDNEPYIPGALDPIHTDASPNGQLALACSEQFSVTIHEGWFLDNAFALQGPTPVLDPNNEAMDRRSAKKPGTWTAWSTGEYGGVHEILTLDQEGLDKIGGKRFFVLVRFGFDKLVLQAQKNLGLVADTVIDPNSSSLGR